METDAATRYRSRILREMNANRDNPFNSPPSSTGSHGTVSPTMSSVFSDPDGESTRRLHEDIARVTAARKLPVNWEAAHRKWPEFYSMPRNRDKLIFDDVTDTRPLSSQSKENKPPASTAAKYLDDTTQDIWNAPKRTRAEMQPRVDNESDLSSILSKSPSKVLSHHDFAKITRNPSPLHKSHAQIPTEPEFKSQRRPSISDALDRLRRASASPRDAREKTPSSEHESPFMSSAKSSLTAVPPSPASMASPDHNASNARSFFMPDVSHLGDFVDGTLRFSGSMKNGVPVFVKHGRVHDQKEKRFSVRHAEVDAIGVPEDEEKIFVSMDMIRDEIISLQEHHDKVQEYAGNLQQQVDTLQAQLKTRNGAVDQERANKQVLAEKKQLELEVADLKIQLEQATRKISTSEISNDTLSQEKDRVFSRLQEACDDINKLTRKLSVREKELSTTHKQLESTEQTRKDNDTLRREITSATHSRDALEAQITTLRREQKEIREETESLRSDNNSLRQDHHSLISENRSLRSTNKSLMEENEDLRENLDGVQHELDAAREEIETLQQEAQTFVQEKATLQEDNNSLVRHNEKYFSENKVLRRENSEYERSVHELHGQNMKLKEDVDFLKQQLDHCRPVAKEDFTAPLDDETEENMTSAFFIPDITIQTNESAPDNTETKEMPELPELTSHTNQLPTVTHDAEQETRNTTKRDVTGRTDKSEAQARSKSKSRAAAAKNSTNAQKVAFSLPEKTTQSTKSSSNMANQGSKRRSTSKALVTDSDPFGENDDTTGALSVDNTTQELNFSMPLKLSKISIMRESKQQQTQEITSQSQKSQSRPLQKQAAGADLTMEILKSLDKDSCPALSSKARRVLDELCEHSCHNCIVCSRITSHRGVVSSTELAAGKKRVTVSRPVPVTDRDLTGDDHTMRPAHSPGYALALVIKGLEDESRHLQLELSRLQARYNASDKALGRRERLSMAEGIRMLLKRLEVKNDQIYSLYDVLEGQKAANQVMSEEEVEMTVLNITGMTVRDVTSGSDQVTWEGIMETS